MTRNKIEDMRRSLELQGSDGNWNYNAYMHGMYNGMEFMLAVAEGRSPVFKEKPEQWVEDNPDLSEKVREAK